MATPTNRQEFSEYCLRKLGKPVIDINVSNEQVDDRIEEALYKFYERNFHAVEEVFIMLDITAPEKVLDSNGNEVLDSAGDVVYTINTDVEKGYLQLDSDIVGVTDVLRPVQTGSLGSVEYQYHINELYSMRNPVSMFNGISYYFMHRSQMTMLNRFFNPAFSYDYNFVTKRLTVAGGLKKADYKFGGLIVRGFRQIHGEAIDSNTEVHNIWKIRWLQEYATALIKQQWASNLQKFSGVTLIGGVQMNGDTLWQQAEQEIERLDRQLQEEYEYPPSFIVG